MRAGQVWKGEVSGIPVRVAFIRHFIDRFESDEAGRPAVGRTLDPHDVWEVILDAIPDITQTWKEQWDHSGVITSRGLGLNMSFVTETDHEGLSIVMKNLMIKSSHYAAFPSDRVFAVAGPSMGAAESDLMEGYPYDFISMALIRYVQEKLAVDETDYFGRDGDWKAVTVMPAPEAYSRLMPVIGPGVDENTFSHRPVFAFNGKIYTSPLVWPPKGMKVVSSEEEVIQEVLCEEKVDQETQDAIMAEAAQGTAIAEGVFSAFPEEPETVEEIEAAVHRYGAFEEIDITASEKGPRILIKMIEDTYLKWWSRYGQENETGGSRCVSIPFLVKAQELHGERPK
jgi:hypothetical protein